MYGLPYWVISALYVVAQPRESDQLPPNEIAISAVHRVGQKTLLRVLPEHRKKDFARRVDELDVAVLKRRENFVLIGER